MIYVICGPTASGKSQLAHRLFDILDKPLIINADAFQIYKGLDILSAKVSKDSPYYPYYRLIDIKEVCDVFSVAEYQVLARKIIDEQIKLNKDVVVCGGTGLYLRALFYDYEFYKQDEQIDLNTYNDYSNEELHNMLKALDPIEANKIHPNNRKRVLRCLNLIKSMKMTKTEYNSKQSHKLIYDNVKFICLNPNRTILYEIINKRVIEMVKQGMIYEIENLFKNNHFSQTSINAIGVREVIDYLNNKISKEEMIELIQKRTRQYAKRQFTFFRHQLPCIMYNDINEAFSDLERDIKK